MRCLVTARGPQGGTEPKSLTGPSSISISRRAIVAHLKTTFVYTVELNQTSSSDTVISITDTANKMSHPSSVTVAAGTLTKNFGATPISAGTTTLEAYNANGMATEDITIDP